MSVIRRILRAFGYSILAVMLLGVLIAAFGTTAAVQQASEQAQVEETKIPTWVYDSGDDVVKGKPWHAATIESNEQVNLEFPYNGAQRAQLTVRRHPSYGVDVFVVLADSQLLCHDSNLSYGECMVTVKVDDGAPQQMKVGKPDDGSSNTLFFTAGKTMKRSIEKASKVVIRMTVYKAGDKTFTFNTVGLDTSKLN